MKNAGLVDKRISHFPDKIMFEGFTERCEMVFKKMIEFQYLRRGVKRKWGGEGAKKEIF